MVLRQPQTISSHCQCWSFALPVIQSRIYIRGNRILAHAPSHLRFAFPLPVLSLSFVLSMVSPEVLAGSICWCHVDPCPSKTRAKPSCLVEVPGDAVVAGGDAAGIAVDVFGIVVVAETVTGAQNVVGPLAWRRVAGG